MHERYLGHLGLEEGDDIKSTFKHECTLTARGSREGLTYYAVHKALLYQGRLMFVLRFVLLPLAVKVHSVTHISWDFGSFAWQFVDFFLIGCCMLWHKKIAFCLDSRVSHQLNSNCSKWHVSLKSTVLGGTWCRFPAYSQISTCEYILQYSYFNIFWRLDKPLVCLTSDRNYPQLI